MKMDGIQRRLGFKDNLSVKSKIPFSFDPSDRLVFAWKDRSYFNFGIIYFGTSHDSKVLSDLIISSICRYAVASTTDALFIFGGYEYPGAF